MKDKIKIFTVTILLLSLGLIGQICYVNYAYLNLKRENNIMESRTTSVNKNKTEEQKICGVKVSDEIIPNFVLIKNIYSNNNYVKYYNFSGEKYDILNKVNVLEKQGIKIKYFNIVDIDKINVEGQLVIEYKLQK